MSDKYTVLWSGTLATGGRRAEPFAAEIVRLHDLRLAVLDVRRSIPSDVTHDVRVDSFLSLIADLLKAWPIGERAPSIPPEPEFPETADLRQELADIATLYPREVLIAAIAAVRKHPLGQRAPEAKP